MSSLAFHIYLLFLFSYFLHLPKRLPFLGALHFDLLLMALMLVLVAAGAGHRGLLLAATTRRIALLAAYIVLSLPLVRWPGSVLKDGIPRFAEVVVFFLFTVALVDTKVKYRNFLVFFVACQSVRVLEPLYLHITTGYWGSITTMDDEMMNRLSGSPNDIVNPNGLAFIITSVLPFYYFFARSASGIVRWVCLGMIPISLYALLLTASRTGALALLVVAVGIMLKSRRKALVLGVAAVALILVAKSLDPLQSDRFRSIFDRSSRGSATAQGRVTSTIRNLRTVLERPLFGHGLGTSIETNANVLGSAMVAHNLYAEILQEIGLVGLVLFLLYVRSIVGNFRSTVRISRKRFTDNHFLRTSTDALEVWFWMNILFSFASYGLSRYEWYLFGGISVVASRLVGLCDAHGPSC